MPDVLNILYRNSMFIISNRYTYCKLILYAINPLQAGQRLPGQLVYYKYYRGRI